MRKGIVLLLIIGLIISSCSKDDKTPESELFKITKVTCVKNSSSNYFVADITYTENSDIKQININPGETEHFIYSNNKVSIASIGTTEFIHTEHTLNRNKIATTKNEEYNPYSPNSTYTAEEITYNYENTNDLTSISWIERHIHEDGTMEEEKFDKRRTFTWERENITQYDFKQTKRMFYEYESQLRPENFPFRVLPNFTPVEFENFSPVNFLFGYGGRYLPKRAYWYHVDDRNNICAEYEFTYNNFLDKYLTSMTITEKIYEASGETPATNTYHYTFEYNYDPN